MNTTAILVVVGLFGAGLVLLVVLTRLDRLRREAMRAAAPALGLTPLDPGNPVTLPSVELLRKKRRGLSVVLAGEWQGQAIHVFDVFYPSTESISRQTVLATRFPGRHWPEFALIERNANRSTPTVDLPKAEDAPEAVRGHWLAYTRSGRWPFSEALTQWLGRGRGRAHWWTTGWAYEGHGDTLYVYRRSATAKPGSLAEWLDEAMSEARGFAEVAGADSGSATVEPMTLTGPAGPASAGLRISVRTTRTWTTKRS
jgi:hypothetical protein